MPNFDYHYPDQNRTLRNRKGLHLSSYESPIRQPQRKLNPRMVKRLALICLRRKITVEHLKHIGYTGGGFGRWTVGEVSRVIVEASDRAILRKVLGDMDLVPVFVGTSDDDWDRPNRVIQTDIRMDRRW